MVCIFSFFQNFDRLIQILSLQVVAKVNHVLIKFKVDILTPVFHDDTGLATCPFNADHIPFVGNILNDHLVGVFNVVPHAQIAPVLRHHHVTQRHPLHLTALVQERSLRLRVDVADGQAFLFVAEDEFGTRGVQL